MPREVEHQSFGIPVGLSSEYHAQFQLLTDHSAKE
jgi:hypothetical protein